MGFQRDVLKKRINPWRCNKTYHAGLTCPSFSSTLALRVLAGSGGCGSQHLLAFKCLPLRSAGFQEKCPCSFLTSLVQGPFNSSKKSPRQNAQTPIEDLSLGFYLRAQPAEQVGYNHDISMVTYLSRFHIQVTPLPPSSPPPPLPPSSPPLLSPPFRVPSIASSRVQIDPRPGPGSGRCPAPGHPAPRPRAPGTSKNAHHRGEHFLLRRPGPKQGLSGVEGKMFFSCSSKGTHPCHVFVMWLFIYVLFLCFLFFWGVPKTRHKQGN